MRKITTPDGTPGGLRRKLASARVSPALVFLAAALLAASVALVARAATPPVRVLQIAAGEGNTCALTSGGSVRCWGYNVQGQLGNGRRGTTSYSSNVPVAVTALARGAKAIAVGLGFGCAITGAGAVRCWGSNGFGQLGNGSPAYQFDVPVGVKGLTGGVTAIAAGGRGACALTSAGGVKCWGANANGQLGNGSRTDSRTPVDVAGLAGGVKAIAASGGGNCALTATGGVKCWGTYPGSGAAGCCSLVPVDVVGLASGVTALAGGHAHTCAVTGGGGLKCWGTNWFGELGTGSTGGGDFTPVDVAGLTSGVRAVAAGQQFTCALTRAGGVKCWGHNRHGQVGNGSKGDRGPVTPADVVGLRSGVVAIAAGQSHACALMSSGRVKCWGANTVGQLGNGSRIHQSSTPVDVRFPGAASAPKLTPAAARARAFVDRLEAVLVQSAAGRRELGAAISAGFTCAIPPGAAAQRIARVIDNRRRLLTRLRSVHGPNRPAAEAITLLRQGLQHSIDADRRYRQGFLAAGAQGCPLPPNSDFAAARRSDGRASAAKRRFVTVFNPLARRFHRRVWSANEF